MMAVDPFPRPIWGVVRYAETYEIRAVCWLCNATGPASATMDDARAALDEHLDSDMHRGLVSVFTQLSNAEHPD
jgi:hypothetical protein